MLAIIDYDAGNIKSVEKAFEKLGQKVEITRSPEKILKADRIVLPGVGNFGDAMGRLDSYGLTSVIRQAAEEQIPVLGICLGLQLFFEGKGSACGFQNVRAIRSLRSAGIPFIYSIWEGFFTAYRKARMSILCILFMRRPRTNAASKRPAIIPMLSTHPWNPAMFLPASSIPRSQAMSACIS